MKKKNKPTQKFRNKQKRRTKKIGGFKFFPSRGTIKIIPYPESMEKKAAKEQDIKKQASEYKQWWNTLESEYASVKGIDINKSYLNKTYYEMIHEVKKDGTMKTKLQKKNDSIKENEFYYRPYCTHILKELVFSLEAREEANKNRNPFNKENKKHYKKDEKVIISNNGEHGKIVEKLTKDMVIILNEDIETQYNKKNCKNDCYVVDVNHNTQVYTNNELKPDTCKTPNLLSITPSKSKPRTPSKSKPRTPSKPKKIASSRRSSSTKK